jgi:rifampicin phosphotransferase
VTTGAYSDFIAGESVAALSELVEGLDYDAARLEMQTGGFRSLICTSTMPDSIAQEIRRAYERLGSPYVAVRSSGTAEDLADASFAGLHGTYLDTSLEPTR